MKDSKKKSFIFYTDWYDTLFKDLSNENTGRLLKMMCLYQLSGNCDYTGDPEIDTAFKFIRAQIDRDSNTYADRCRKNAENAHKRWKNANNANGCERIQTDANDADNDTDNHTDNDSDTDKYKRRKRDNPFNNFQQNKYSEQQYKELEKKMST